MGAVCGSVESEEPEDMCVGRLRADDIDHSSEIHGEQTGDEEGIQSVIQHSSLIEQLIEEGYYEHLPIGEGEPEVVWIYGSDEHWHLCVECSFCYTLMLYPGGAHNCPGVDEEGENTEDAVYVRAVLASPTTIEAEGERLLCDESIGSTSSDVGELGLNELNLDDLYGDLD